MCLEIHTHMCVKAMNEKLKHGFENEQRRVNGKVWGDDKDGENEEAYYIFKK